MRSLSPSRSTVSEMVRFGKLDEQFAEIVPLPICDQLLDLRFEVFERLRHAPPPLHNRIATSAAVDSGAASASDMSPS